MLFDLIAFVLIGLFVGAFARLPLPGRDPMPIWMTILIGVGGSLIGGILSHVLLGRPAGLLISILCATVIVYFVRRSRGGSLTDPGRPPGLRGRRRAPQRRW